MARIPIANISKVDLIKMSNWKCPHGHNGIDHYRCWITHMKEDYKVGILDIETSHLKADMGIMLSYAIKEHGTKNIVSSCITPAEVKSDNMDKRLVKDCIKDMSKFDKLVTYYGTGFDLPFIRARAIANKLDFPLFGSIDHTDIYYIVKSKLNIRRKSLECACQLYGIEGKNHVLGKFWLKALGGNKKALDYILDHNKRDVIITDELYDKIRVFSKELRKSI